MSKVLVTGATGFVGREVCRHLRKKGHTVTGTTRDQNLTVGPENIPLYHVPEFNNGMDWSPAVSGVDAVVHLAARVHQINDQSESPLSEYRRVNLDGTKTLAVAAAAAG
ncbi:MAG: NAD-dependent epimerase/dehydratase family protein, partial [Rhodospirillales bacterium]|nr:NAD-dependent epimerase/dehydratase family protein [Rhodospirillales bacterium]